MVLHRFWEGWAKAAYWVEQWEKALATPYIRPVGYAWLYVRVLVSERDGEQCNKCGRSGVRLQLHHVRSLSEGGNSQPDNLVLLCYKCHAKEHEGEACCNLIKKICVEDVEKTMIEVNYDN